jgi:hypothetical protein
MVLAVGSQQFQKLSDGTSKMHTRTANLGLGAILACVMAVGTTFANPIGNGVALFLQSGVDTAEVSGSTSTTGSASVANYDNTLNGWTVYVTAISFAPTLDTTAGIDVGGVAYTCVPGVAGCSTDPLSIVISAPGFNEVIGTNGFLLQYGGSINGDGKLSSSAWWDTNGSDFCNPNDPGTPATNCGSSNLLGTLNLGPGSTGASVTGGPDPIRSYSLTINDSFGGGAGDPFYSFDTGVVQSVPEPGTLGLVMLGRRRRARQS